VEHKDDRKLMVYGSGFETRQDETRRDETSWRIRNEIVCGKTEEENFLN
jgi:hypothetical protein